MTIKPSPPPPPPPPHRLLVFGIVGTVLLTGCASIIDEETQVVSVRTPYCPGAECVLENSNGTFFVKSTPDTITIHKSSGDLSVKCTKDGHTETESFESSANAAMWGNLLFGGIIGAAVDWQDSGFDYEPNIVNSLRCGDEEAEKTVREEIQNSKLEETESSASEVAQGESDYERCLERSHGRLPAEVCGKP